MLEGLWLAVELTVWFDGLRSTLQNAVEKVEPAVGDHRISVSCKPRGVRVRAWAYEWRNRDSTDLFIVDRFLSYALYALAHAPSRTLPLPRFVPMVGLCPFVPRTPNPDHKGTNTIGREVREEIGWENGRRMNGNNSWMKGRSWSCSTVHSSVLFHPIGGAVAWAVEHIIYKNIFCIIKRFDCQHKLFPIEFLQHFMNRKKVRPGETKIVFPDHSLVIPDFTHHILFP